MEMKHGSVGGSACSLGFANQRSNYYSKSLSLIIMLLFQLPKKINNNKHLQTHPKRRR
jgi:hypothetical protein